VLCISDLIPVSKRKSYNLAGVNVFILTEKRTIPICLTPEQLKMVEEYAKKKGMLNPSQAIEELTK
jgi:hypothetical protein